VRWLFTLIVGVLIGGLLVFYLRPEGEPDRSFGHEAVWRYGGDTERLAECGNIGEEGETRCALRVMTEGGASEEARSFFRETHWFLSDFTESGVVDVGEVVTPWRANSNDDYVLMNGSPSVVYVEREAPPVALFGQDPAYEPLRRFVNAKDDIPEEDDLVLWATDERYESTRRSDGKVGFVFQWALNDACHACRTGYAARAALEFASDGTYLSADPINICLQEHEGERMVPAPDCPPLIVDPASNR
jgi:hypothetical protein